MEGRSGHLVWGLGVSRSFLVFLELVSENADQGKRDRPELPSGSPS